MQIDTRTVGKMLVVEIVGQLMTDSAINLRHSIDDWSNGEQDHVVLDLTGVSYIDSTGIGAIVAAHKNLKRLGKHTYFCGAAGQVGEMMKFLRIDKVIPCYPDLDSLRKSERL